MGSCGAGGGAHARSGASGLGEGGGAGLPPFAAAPAAAPALPPFAGAPSLFAAAPSAAAAAEWGSSPPDREVARKERVRQETREQIPHLTKMKQKLCQYSASFSRLASDALLVGWDADFECTLLRLEEDVACLHRKEASLAAFDTALDPDTRALLADGASPPPPLAMSSDAEDAEDDTEEDAEEDAEDDAGLGRASLAC